MQESWDVRSGSVLNSDDYTIVQNAIDSGSLEELYRVVTRDTGFFDYTIFHMLVRNGDVELVKALLKRIKNSEYADLIDRKTSTGKTPLTCAVELSNNNSKMAQLLIESGAKLDVIHPLFCTYDVAKLLIQAGYDLDNPHGKRKLEEYRSDEEISPTMILINRAQKNYQYYCKIGFLPKDYAEKEAVLNRLFYAAYKKMGQGDVSWKYDLEAVYLYYIHARQLPGLMRLIQSSDFTRDILVQFNQLIPKYFDWYVAIRRNEIEALQIFLACIKNYKLSFNMSTSVKSGFTPINLAVFYGHEKIVDLLIDTGVRVDQKYLDESPLGQIFAGTKEPDQHVQLLKKLLRAGANPNARSYQGYSALYYVVDASFNDPLYAAQMVQLLLQAGAYPDGKELRSRFEDYRITPIYCAVCHSCMPVIQLLAFAGATFNKNIYKNSIKNREILQYLSGLEKKYAEFKEELNRQITGKKYVSKDPSDKEEETQDLVVAGEEAETAINRWYYECTNRGEEIYWVYTYYIRLNKLEELSRLRKSRLFINHFAARVMPSTDNYFSKKFNDIIKDAEKKRAISQQKIYNHVQGNNFSDVLVFTHQKPLGQIRVVDNKTIFL